MQVINIEDGGVRIHQKGRIPKYNIEFWNKINEYYNKGYRFRETNLEGGKIRSAPKFIPQVIVPLYPEEKSIFELENIIKDKNKEIEKLKFNVEYLKEEIDFLSNDIDEEKKIDFLDKLTKKKELISFAEKENIEVPDDMNQPTAIKKFIKSELNV